MRRRRPLEDGTLLPQFLDGNLLSRVEELERQMRVLERVGLTTSAAGGSYGRRWLLEGWGDDNLAANQGATRLFRFGNVENWQRAVILARGGTITGLGVVVSEARTGGSATVEIYVAGAATGVTAVLDAGATLYTWETAAVSFEAGEGVELYLTTSGWGPTSADLQAVIEVAPE